MSESPEAVALTLKVRKLQETVDRLQAALDVLAADEASRIFNPFESTDIWRAVQLGNHVQLMYGYSLRGTENSVPAIESIVSTGRIVRVASSDLLFVRVAEASQLLPINVELIQPAADQECTEFDETWVDKELRITWDPVQHIALEFSLVTERPTLG